MHATKKSGQLHWNEPIYLILEHCSQLKGQWKQI